jgi:hypothetical protein
MDAEQLNHVGTRVLDAAFAVHSSLGPGLLESAYKGFGGGLMGFRDERRGRGGKTLRSRRIL